MRRVRPSVQLGLVHLQAQLPAAAAVAATAIALATTAATTAAASSSASATATASDAPAAASALDGETVVVAWCLAGEFQILERVRPVLLRGENGRLEGAMPPLAP